MPDRLLCINTLVLIEYTSCNEIQSTKRREEEKKKRKKEKKKKKTNEMVKKIKQ